MKTLTQTVCALIAILPPYAIQAQPADIMLAARDGDLPRVVELLASGVEPDPKGIATPLYFAAQGGHIQMVNVLIENRADPNAMSKWGTPLHVAARSGHTEIVETLLQSGADPNILEEERSETPLHKAAEKGVVDIGRLLIDHGADVNARNRYREPPIHLAMFRGRLEFAELLRESGASGFKTEPISDFIEGADLEKGRIRSLECGSCHPMTKDGPLSEDGPTLWNIVGRRIAGLEYLYSEAMQAEVGFWTIERLNSYLADPPGYLPGNKMHRGFVETREERIGVIAYLRTLSDSPVPLP